MMKKTLLIIATSLGTPYNSTKQLVEIGPNGELLMEYGIYDAIDSGFNKLVFIVNKSTAKIVIPKIKNLLRGLVEIHFVVQDIDDVSLESTRNINKKNSLGTVHAIWAARHHISEPFLVISSHDFYGRNAYKVASNFFENDDKNYAVLTYKLGNVLSKYGTVKRGVCSVKSNSKALEQIIEFKEIKRKCDDSKIIHRSTAHTHVELSPNMDISVDMFCLRPSFFLVIKSLLKHFTRNESNINYEELSITDVIQYAITSTNISTLALESNSDWFGMTYKADRIMARYKIEDKIRRCIYPKVLFNYNEATMRSHPLITLQNLSA